MTAQGKANYEAYRKVAGRPGVSAHPLPEYEQLPMELRYAFDAGADAVELWLSQAPVDEDAPGNEPQPELRYALVEQMGFRRTYGTVRETEFCGKPMLEVTSLETGAVHLAAPESLYQVTWLSREQAERATRTGSHSPAALTAAVADDLASWGDEDDEDPWPGDEPDAGETAAILADPDTVAAIAEGEADL